MAKTQNQKPALPNGWREVRLGEIAKVVGGGTPQTKNPEYWNGGIPWITPKDLSGISNRYIAYGGRSISETGVDNSNATKIPKGAVLLSTRAPVGYLAIADCEVTTNQGFKSLVVDEEKSHNLFLFYLLKNNVSYLQSCATGTTFGELAGATLKSISLLFPPLPQQKTIAEVLSSFDDKIDLLRRQNATLEAIAQTLFRQQFVKKAEAGWGEVYLNDIYEFIKGSEPGSKNYRDTKAKNSVRFVRVGDMLSMTATNFIDKSLAKITCDKNDLLVSFDGTVGRVVFGVAGAYSSGIRKIVSQQSAYDHLGFKYLLFKTRKVQNTIHAHATGSVILHASSAIKYLSMKFPPKDVILRFNALIEPLFSKICCNQTQIRTLEQLRDTLLPRLMRGEVKVKG